MALDNETKLYIREVVHEALAADRELVEKRINERIEHHVLVCANRGYRHWQVFLVAVGTGLITAAAPHLPNLFRLLSTKTP